MAHQSCCACNHARQLAEHGGGVGLRDESLLESALQRPLSRVLYGQPEVADLAAEYAFGIARNHPFVDGNKRTSLIVARTFLLLNGYQISASKEDRFATWISLAAGELTVDQLADWFRRWLVEA